MRLLLLFSFSILLSSATFSFPTYGADILEILIESGASVHTGFVVTYENKSHVTWRHLKPNTPELLIFEGFDLSNSSKELMNVTIHNNITSNSVIFNPWRRPVYDINELPLPYTGLQMKFKCAEDWYGTLCHQHCLVKERWRCDKHGSSVCAPGYCGWNCHKFGSGCPNFSCKNGGECYGGDRFSVSSTLCHCPTGYYGNDCEIFYIIEEKLNFMTNFGANLTVSNKFLNRTDIYQLFEKYEEKPRTSGHQDAQTYQSFGKLAEICVLIWLVATMGYYIVKCCGKSVKNEKKIVETSGDEKKKTSEEEKKCILIEMNDM
ncbi:hypothetical protein GCK72_015479 [Caenorhabditis remanei]|uniref:Delta-like protein n=1 Tax=Caenorhabditis remanei TaxID=31234 RepID=A0A6A5GWU0_CAERE|nr:hypothetical protein GCK72_015479 [Caenorhabditis remanei]KAF1759019.1 hypothetical protein GCK72_015479 [Caenorhabditis remanei]